MSIFRCFILVALLLTSACVTKTTVRHSANYSAALTKSPNLTLLPAEVIVNTVNVGNQKERMYDYEYHLEGVFTREMTAVLEAKGYHVERLQKADLHKQKLLPIMLDLRSQYGGVRSSLYTPYYMDEKIAFSVHKKVGDKAVELGEKTNSSVFVFVDYAGTVKTNGARARDLALDLLVGTSNSANVDASSLIIGIVDASTGDVLWANSVKDTQGIYDSVLDNMRSQDVVESKRIHQLITNALKSLPARN